MNALPVLFMTKETDGRDRVAESTMTALKVYLEECNSKPLFFYLAVAGSMAYLEKLVRILENQGFTGRYFFMQFEEATAGYAWNQLVKKIFDDGHEMYLRMEDDFVLKQPLNISPYIELLETKGNVGMVRLGLMPINLNLFSVGWYDQGNNGHIFFDCLPSTSYAYSGNPGLVHKRLHDAVGYFHEQHNPGNIEIDFDSRVRAKMMDGGPRIWWPLELGKYGTYGPWNHIGQVKSYKEN